MLLLVPPPLLYHPAAYRMVQNQIVRISPGPIVWLGTKAPFHNPSKKDAAKWHWRTNVSLVQDQDSDPINLLNGKVDQVDTPVFRFLIYVL